jgi:hypothetical protein
MRINFNDHLNTNIVENLCTVFTSSYIWDKVKFGGVDKVKSQAVSLCELCSSLN